jgi:hypothetical protein
MIAANELRIGNWVDAEIGTLKKPNRANIVINGVYTSTPPPSVQSYIISYGRSIDLNNLLPIPLTPEILEKCGFVKQMMWTYAIDIVGNIKLVYYLGEKGWSIGNKNYSDFSNLNYLHQLQNLYFSLTGTELKYTP